MSEDQKERIILKIGEDGQVTKVVGHINIENIDKSVVPTLRSIGTISYEDPDQQEQDDEEEERLYFYRNVMLSAIAGMLSEDQIIYLPPEDDQTDEDEILDDASDS